MKYARSNVLTHDQPRLARTLEYRPRMLTIVYWTTMVLTVFIIVGLIYIRLESLQEMPLQWLDLAILVPGLLIWQVQHSVRPLIFSKVHLNVDQMTLEEKNRTRKFLFQDIESFDSQWNSRWLRIIFKDKQELELSLMLERSEYVVDSIMKFDKKFSANPTLQKYRANALMLDHFYARVSDSLKASRKLLVQLVVIPIVGSLLYSMLRYYNHTVDSQDLFANWFFIINLLVILSCVVGGITWISAEFLIQRKGIAEITRDPQAVRRDLLYEQHIHKIQFRVYLGIMVALAAFFILAKVF